MIEKRKQQYWNHFLQLESLWPYGTTKKKLEKVKPFVWKDKEFWEDILLRHNGKNCTPEEMNNIDRFIYDHCMGNMSGMICQIMIEKEIIKSL